ncbi:MAG: heparan-alpha-glucosaminide N-acetyltransferase [Candidatus Micrarchaeota archaeon]
MNNRIWQLDFARGIAVIGMVAYNWLFALAYLGKIDFPINDPPYFWFARIVAFCFVFIAGASLAISYKRAIASRRGSEHLGKTAIYKFLTRGLKLFGLGLLITLATYLYEPSATIWFGILHLLGISSLLALPIIDALERGKIRMRSITLISASIILAGILLPGMSFDFPYLLWLGFWPNGWYTFDYFPILPWFGFFLMGIVAGKKWFWRKEKTANGAKGGMKPKSASNYPPAPKLLAPIAFLGRHSLFIYLAHQPILLLAVKLGLL